MIPLRIVVLTLVTLAGGPAAAQGTLRAPARTWREAPAILDLQYRTIDRAGDRADLGPFRGVTLRAPLVHQPASVGPDTLTFGSGMMVCPRAPRKCRRIAVAAPAFLDLHGPTTAELNVTRANTIAAHEASQRATLIVGYTMLYGIEPEPVLEFELKREMLLFLAKMLQDSRVVSAALAIEPTSSIRAIREAQLADRERLQGTYVEIEDYEVVTATASVPVMVALAGTGAGLFGAGLFGQKMLHGALGDALAIRPQPWPLGLQIGGKFLSP
jgi:hypothetical protein